MENMELNNLIEQIKVEFPDKAIDILESLELLRETINDTIESVAGKVNTSISNRNFEKMKIYSELAQRSYEYELKIEEIMNMLDIEAVEVEEETDEETEIRNIPNYAEYIVDNYIEHTLYENFTHKRPFGFKINENHISQVKTWQDMLIKTCEYLISLNEQKFMSFENKDSMNGKKNKYFSMNPDNMRRPRKVADKIYIETNQSGNSIRNLIIKLLKEYDFKINEYKVYFRADYTNLNND